LIDNQLQKLKLR